MFARRLATAGLAIAAALVWAGIGAAGDTMRLDLRSPGVERGMSGGLQTLKLDNPDAADVVATRYGGWHGHRGGWGGYRAGWGGYRGWGGGYRGWWGGYRGWYGYRPWYRGWYGLGWPYYYGLYSPFYSWPAYNYDPYAYGFAAYYTPRVIYRSPVYYYSTQVEVMPYVAAGPSSQRTLTSQPQTQGVLPPAGTTTPPSYQYDGGPRSPVPLPQARPKPSPGTPTRAVSLPSAAPRYRFRAYGEKPEPTPTDNPRLIAVKATGK